MMGCIEFDGKSCRDFSANASAYETFKTPVRDVENVTIQGRNGDLLYDNKRYDNVEIVYQIIINKDFKRNYEAFKDFLLSRVGYKRLKDTMHPEFYRLARVSKEIEPDVGRGGHVGTFDLTFDCKPQKYLLSGENKITLTAAGDIYNPTQFEAKPLIRVYGKGDLQVGSKTVKITAADGYTDLDCEIQDAYRGTVNCNANVQITDYDFPVLPAGKTGIRLGTGITKVEITPRWWTL